MFGTVFCNKNKIHVSINFLYFVVIFIKLVENVGVIQNQHIEI